MLLHPLVSSLGKLDSVLDFGCGDGWFSRQMLEAEVVGDLVSLDVKRRETVYVEPVIYKANEPIPYPDSSFDLVYTVDVLHHCDDPLAQLTELARVSKRYLLIKDHTYRTQVGRMTLAVLDELGNRKFGIPSPYNYQQLWSWKAHLERLGWFERALIHPARCHVGIMGALTNSLQYVGLYERRSV